MRIMSVTDGFLVSLTTTSPWHIAMPLGAVHPNSFGSKADFSGNDYARFAPTPSSAFSRALTALANPVSATCTLAKRTPSGLTGVPFLRTS